MVLDFGKSVISDRKALWCVFIAQACLISLGSQEGRAETVSVTLSRDICLQLVTEALPSSDVAYVPGQDARSNSVAPADLGGGVTLQVPDKVTLPIEIDVRRYLKAPPQDTADKQAQLAQNRTRFDQASGVIEKSQAQVADQLSLLSSGNKALSDQISVDPTDPDLSEGLQKGLETVIETATDLSRQPETFQTSAEILKQSEKTLQQTVSEFESNPRVIQRNTIFQQEAVKGVGDVSNGLQQSQSDLRALDQELQILSQSVQDISDRLDEETRVTLLQKVSEAESALLQSQESFSKDNVSANILDSLAQTGKSLAALGVSDLKIPYVKEASVGSVVFYLDGRAYFEGQPLFNQDQAQIKEACRRYLAENP